MEPINLAMSRAYTLRIAESRLGSAPAIHIAMQHTDTGGNVSVRGGFHIHATKVPELADALSRYYAGMRDAVESDAESHGQRRGY